MIRPIRNVVLLVIAAVALAAFVMTLQSSTGSTPGDPRGEQQHEHAGENVEINDERISAAGIEILTAGPGTLRDTLILNGILQPNQEAVVQVTPRFPGIAREIRKRVGDHVKEGDVLARVESNQSLTVYELRAPIAGTIIDRQIALGEYASEQKPAFTVADLSTVWADVSVYRRDLTRVNVGDVVLIDADDGGPPIEAKISYVSPVGSSDTQSALARAVVDNKDMRLRPGLFVTAHLILAAKPAPIVVKNSALQTVENRTVVFVRNGNKFEPRDVELGDRDQDNIEVLFGLIEGDRYAAKNSFVIKAELAKGSAAHEH
ncbi:MAG: divalent metal ion exporter adaptor subunit IhpB [Xanthobacteraceae bacterium]